MLFRNKNIFSTEPRTATSGPTKHGDAPRTRLLSRFLQRRKTPALPQAIFPAEFPRLPDPAIRKSYQQPLKNKNRTVVKDKRPRVVRFQEQVKVVEIPSRRSYDTITRRTLWRNSQEIRAMGRRNASEARADGGSKNWRNFLEEDQFQVFAGQLFHPVTFAKLQKRQEQLQRRRRACQQKKNFVQQYVSVSK